jgi:FkbM family methyltransferase
MASRLDVPNDPVKNGEVLLQSAVLSRVTTADALVIFDVGANTGQWSTLLLRTLQRHVGAQVELHLFEPSPTAFEALQVNLSQVAHSVRLTCNELAVSNFTGSADFSIVAPLSQVNTLAPLEPTSALEIVTVSCVTLDEYCLQRRLPRIYFAKIDTEGNDFRVLEGARDLLMHGCVEYLQFEYNHRWIAFRSYLKDVFDLIQPFQYSIGKLTPKGIEFYDRWHPDLEKFVEGNYLLCKKVYRSQLPSVPWWNET